jgi:hypothetical protein
MERWECNPIELLRNDGGIWLNARLGNDPRKNRGDGIRKGQRAGVQRARRSLGEPARRA